jgi:hypothetical protein
MKESCVLVCIAGRDEALVVIFFACAHTLTETGQVGTSIEASSSQARRHTSCTQFFSMARARSSQYKKRARLEEK